MGSAQALMIPSLKMSSSRRLDWTRVLRSSARHGILGKDISRLVQITTEGTFEGTNNNNEGTFEGINQSLELKINVTKRLRDLIRVKS